MKRGVIFSDVDGTLVFHGEIHGIEEMSKNNGLVIVKDLKDNTLHEAFDVSTNLYRVYFDSVTKELCHQLKEDYDFVFVSGARKSTMTGRINIMDFADAYILENGGLILDKNYSVDKSWDKLLDSERAHLKDINKYLISKKLVLDIEGRTSGIRIRLKDNPGYSKDEFKELSESLKLPFQLKKTMNIGSTDIILAGAGKDNAVKYLVQKLGYNYSQSIGIGDDINDIGMLKETKHNYVLASSYPELIELAIKQGWYISKGNHFNGINEILRHLLNS